MAMYSVTSEGKKNRSNNRKWVVIKTTDTVNKKVSYHRTKQNAIEKARQLKDPGDSAIAFKDGKLGSEPI